MAQYDVYKNANKRTSAHFPFLLEVQSDVFEGSTRAVYIPLINSCELKKPDKTLNAAIKIDDHEVRLFPLDIASARRDSVGAAVCNIRSESDAVVAALDLLFARF